MLCRENKIQEGKIVKKIAKVLAVLMALSMLLTACTPKVAEPAAPAAEPAAEATTQEAATVVASDKTAGLIGDESQDYVLCAFFIGHTFWSDVFTGFENAGKVMGVNVTMAGSPEYDLNAAIAAFDQVVATNPKGIALSCMDAEAYNESIQKALAKGIKVVTFDSDAPDSGRYTYVGGENYSAGATAAKFIGEQAAGANIEVGVLTMVGQANMESRVQGFVETLEKNYPNAKVVQVVNSGTDPTEATNAASALMKNNPELDYFFCSYAVASQGAEQAISEANKVGDIKIVTFDTDAVTLDSIKAGTVEGTVTQNPWTMGYWSLVYLTMLSNDLVKPAENWEANGLMAVPYSCNSGSMVVTVANADNFYPAK